MEDTSKNMARKEDEAPTSSSPPIRGLEDLTQNEMFKVLLDQLTIIDEDAKDRRKQIVLSIFNQLVLLSKAKTEADEKLKLSEEMNRVLTKKLNESIDLQMEVDKLESEAKT